MSRSVSNLRGWLRSSVCGETRVNVFLRAVRRKPHGAGAASNEEIAVPGSLNPLPFQEYRFWAALAGYDANRLALNDLHFRINAGARPIAKSVADHLCEMEHVFVIIFELIVLNANDRTIVGYTDQEVATLGVKK